MSEDILDRARKICEQRGEHYGDPHEDFSKIAHLWDVVLESEFPITPEQVSLCMILVKVARITQNHNYYHADSVLDIIGYANCLEKVATRHDTVTLDKMKEVLSEDKDGEEEDMFS